MHCRGGEFHRCNRRAQHDGPHSVPAETADASVWHLLLEEICGKAPLGGAHGATQSRGECGRRRVGGGRDRSCIMIIG